MSGYNLTVPPAHTTPGPGFPLGVDPSVGNLAYEKFFQQAYTCRYSSANVPQQGSPGLGPFSPHPQQQWTPVYQQNPYSQPPGYCETGPGPHSPHSPGDSPVNPRANPLGSPSAPANTGADTLPTSNPDSGLNSSNNNNNNVKREQQQQQQQQTFSVNHILERDVTVPRVDCGPLYTSPAQVPASPDHSPGDGRGKEPGWAAQCGEAGRGTPTTPCGGLMDSYKDSAAGSPESRRKSSPGKW